MLISPNSQLSAADKNIPHLHRNREVHGAIERDVRALWLGLAP